MNSEKLLKQTSWALALTLCVVCVVAGCGKSEPEVSPATPNEYMHDKAFMSKLDEQEKEKRGLMKRFAQARAELEAERAKNPKSERVAELEKYMQKLEAEHQANCKHTQELVRERLTRGKENLKK